MAGRLLPHFESILVSSLAQDKIFAVYEKVAGIILAAGAGRRFGKPKQLLDWKGQPFVRVVAKTAIEAGLSPVIVVTGANHEEVEPAIKDLNVMVVQNEKWQSGQASSIREGLQALLSLPPDRRFTKSQSAGAAIFLLADQPQVDSSILRVLIERHAEGLFDIVAPLVMDRRANPVLFDQTTFSDLLHLEGDVGGRAIFHKYRVDYLPWHDDRLLLDVDTPEQYQRLIKDDTL
jgi:molybdenum cofactor cytidylyltransferase